MKKILLTASCFLLMAHSTFAQVKILFDATEGQTAGNADWVIDADAHNVQYTGTGGLPVQVTSTVQQDNAQRIPTPAQSGITASTPETYWTGALSNWGIDMVKKGYAVETLPTFDSITYGNFSNPQDLSNYKVFIVDEPQFPFSAHTKLALMNFIHNGGGLFIISDHINASRTNNGWDARGVWEDFITHNPVSNTAFGFKLDSVNISPTSANVNPSLTDSIIHGPEGNCPGMQWHNGTTFTLYPAENSSITGDVFMGAVGNTGVMAGHGRYGSGKFAFEGDSSPADDGTGDRYGVASTGVYNGYTGDPTSAPSTEEETIIVNTTIWLATSNSATTLSATTTQTNISCNGGNNGSATVTPSGGTPAYTYSWSPSGGTAATATGLAAGTYTVTVKDAASSTQTASVTITQPLAISTTTTQTNVSCNGSNNGSANISATGGTPSFTYSWSPSGGTSATASGLAANTYTCTITDSKGCTATKSVIISQPSAITTTTTQTNVSCNGSSNGSANIFATGGTPGYTYSWSPSGGTSATASGLAANTYTCTITDSKGCTATKSVIITQPSAITATTTQTNVSCNGDNNGVASVAVSGGTAGYTYSWSSGGGNTASASGLAANTYTCTITDSKGCTATKSVIISQPFAITTATTQTNVSCNGSNNGSANVSATGGTPGYTYSWSSGGGNTASASGLAANTYTCTITDSKGCTATKSVIISQPFAITTATTQTNVSCNGSNNGSANIFATGGTPGYTYSWSPSGGTSATASGLAANTYTCTITDSKGCTSTESVVITQPLALTATTSSTNSSGSGINDGTASTNPSGGTSPYTYSWSPSGETTETATGLAGGIYTCTIIDANGCSIVETDTVNVSTGIAVLNGISSGISLYPNPSGNDVNIVVGSIKNHPVLYFYDILGQQVQAITIKNTQTIISKGTLQSGIYFYRLMNDFGMAGNGKLIIVK